MGKLLVISEGAAHTIFLELSDRTATLTFRGLINEDLNFGNILTVIAPHFDGLEQLMLDVGEVSRMNSCGVREWLLFLERIPPAVSVVFSQVGEAFIQQAGIVPTLLGKKGTPVLSFLAPYRCARCKMRTTQAVEVASVGMKDGAPVPPGFQCLSCKTPMELDALDQEYLRFIEHAKQAGQKPG